MQCFKSEIVNGLWIDQCGGEDESGNLPRGAAFPCGLQTFADGSESGQLTAPMNPESPRTSATRHSDVCLFGPDGSLGDLFRPV